MDQNLNRHRIKEDLQVANKQLKICSPLFAIRKMQINTTKGCHHILIKMTKIKKNTPKKTPFNTNFWQECGGTGTLIYCWWGIKMIQSFWKRVWQFLTKLNTFLLYNPAITLLGIYLCNLKMYLSKRLHRI